jgi:hypothetical protein
MTEIWNPCLALTAHVIPHPAISDEGAIILDDDVEIWILVNHAADIAPRISISKIHLVDLRRSTIDAWRVRMEVLKERRRAVRRIGTGLFAPVIRVANLRRLVRQVDAAAGDALDVWLAPVAEQVTEAREAKRRALATH